MYAETILYIIGGACAFLVLFFGMYLIAFRKRSRVYQDVLRQETEFFDALTATSLLTQGKSSKSTAAQTTEALPGGKISSFATEILSEEHPENIDFDASALEGRYIACSSNCGRWHPMRGSMQNFRFYILSARQSPNVSLL